MWAYGPRVGWDQRFLGNEEEPSETRQSCKQESKGWPALKALIPVIFFKFFQEMGPFHSDGVSRKALAYLDQKQSAVADLDTAKKEASRQLIPVQYQGLRLLELDRHFAWWSFCRIMDVSQTKYRPMRS